MIKFLLKILLGLVYRVDVRYKIPKGKVLVIANHVSYMDAIFLYLYSNRKLKFVMYYKIYNLPVLKYFFSYMGAIPISSNDEDSAILKSALRSVSSSLQNDEAVVIFPEGKISLNGELQEFKPGVLRLSKLNDCDIYPIAINNLYGSHFSKAKKKAFFGKFFARIELRGGGLIKNEGLNTYELREYVLKLQK